MQLKFLNNSILSTHYLNYLNMLETNNNKLVSINLTDTQILELYDKKYKLSEFDIYKYITTLDYAINTLNCNKFKFIEGIKSDKNKYNNILVDLFFNNISIEIMFNYSITIVFGIKQVKYGEIQDLTPLDIKKYKLESPFNLNKKIVWFCLVGDIEIANN